MGFRYVGEGAFYHGIPARDLSDDEYEALAPEQKKLVREGGLYESAAASATLARLENKREKDGQPVKASRSERTPEE